MGAGWMVFASMFYSPSTYYCSKTFLSSISTQGMWAMLGQSCPFPFEHLCFRSGQSLIYSRESVSGSPSLGQNDWSLGQRWIRSSSSEVRVWRVREDRDFRFWKSWMERKVRVVGRIGGLWPSEKEATRGNMPPMVSFLREVSVARPHRDRGVLIFSQR